jgi:hypothetical protein
MRFSVLACLIVAASVMTTVYAQEVNATPPPPADGAPPTNEQGAPPAPPPDAANEQGTPPAAASPASPAGHGKGRKTRRFRAGEEILIRGGRSCYLRPACKKEQSQSRFKGKLSGPRILCGKGKPTAQQREFVWKAHLCKSPEAQKKGYVRFENGKHPGKFLCLTRKEHKSPNRKHGAHFGILGHLKNRGCAWKVKEAKVYNRHTKQLETRFVFVNRKHKRYMLRTRRRCKKAQGAQTRPRRLYGAQNYLREARVDSLGAFHIEPVAPAEESYNE